MAISMVIRSVFSGVFLVGAFAAAGCSSDEGKTDGGTTPTPTTTSTSQSCKNGHTCIGTACRCVQPPKKDIACCDPDESSCASDPKNCKTFCEVCE